MGSIWNEKLGQAERASPLDSTLLGLVDRYWAEFLGCAPGMLRREAAQLVGRAAQHIAVVTHPAFRGHGYATTAVSTLTETVFERTLVPQYRTLEANAPSLAVARQLGFVPYATSLAVRFALPSGEGNFSTG